MAPLTQKPEECKASPAQPRLFEFLVNSRGGRVVVPGCMKVKRWRRTLTGRVGPMGVRTGVGGRAVAPQGGVALTAVGRREGDGTAKLAVRTGRRNKPTTYWLHRREETKWSQVSGTACDTMSDKLINGAILTLRVSRLLVFIHIFSYIFGISSEKMKRLIIHLNP